MGKFVVAILLFAAVVGSIPHRMMGQSNASLLEGVVLDETGAVLQDCIVILLSSETGTRLETRTNDAGVYLYPRSSRETTPSPSRTMASRPTRSPESR